MHTVNVITMAAPVFSTELTSEHKAAKQTHPLTEQICGLDDPHIPRDRAATKAVVMLLAHRTAAWSSSTPPLEIAPKQTAATAARKPTTVAWTCTVHHVPSLSSDQSVETCSAAYAEDVT